MDDADEAQTRGDEQVEDGEVMRFESTDAFIDYLDAIADGRE